MYQLQPLIPIHYNKSISKRKNQIRSKNISTYILEIYYSKLGTCFTSIAYWLENKTGLWNRYYFFEFGAWFQKKAYLHLYYT